MNNIVKNAYFMFNVYAEGYEHEYNLCKTIIKPESLETLKFPEGSEEQIGLMILDSHIM